MKDSRGVEQYSDTIQRLYPELHKVPEGVNETSYALRHGKNRVFTREVTFQVTDRCSLACFPAGTKILMGDLTYKNIEDIVIGDEVMSFTLNSTVYPTLEKTKVTHTFTRHDKVLDIVDNDGVKVSVTPEHPFLYFRKEYIDNKWVKCCEWIKAEELKAGDIIYEYDNKYNCITVNLISTDYSCFSEEYVTVYNMETENHHYIANNFLVHNCTYCYQINKGKRRMSFETAKKFVDLLLTGDKGFSEYINKDCAPAIVLDFIGGEPFLEVELIDKTCDYFMDKAIELHHPWANNFMISICSNGVAYFEPAVQKFLNKWKNRISFSITIDGDKELHDSCRVFPDGSPSYDKAVAAAKDWMNKGYYMGSKVTIAPGNIDCLGRALKHMMSLGYDDINCNCVYENVWEQEHATKLYRQLKDFIDYLYDNDLEDSIYLSILHEQNMKWQSLEEMNVYCWAKGTPILTINGYKPIEEIKVGDFVYTPQGNIKPVINTMHHFADNCVEIQASGVMPMVCTKDHKLFAMPYDGFGGIESYKPFGEYTVEEIANVSNPIKSKVLLGILPNTRYVDVDKNVAYLLGRTIGDGWTIGNVPHICCGKQDYNELKSCFDAAGIKYHINEIEYTYQFAASVYLNTNNPNYNLYVRLCQDIGKGAQYKHIPVECLQWNNASLEALLFGYASADGYLKPPNDYRMKTSSLRLAEEIMLICRTIGYNPLCDTPRYLDGTTEIIMGRTVTRHGNMHNIGFHPILDTKSKCYTENDDGMFTSRFRYHDVAPQEVYNITVADDHAYIAGSLASRNCGGLGLDMIACDPDGNLYSCLRFMESSLGDQQKAPRLGHVDRGLVLAEEEKCIVCDMNTVNRRTYNTDECFYCPIATGCGDCAAYNYQSSGSFHKRATYICEMHKARCLATAYYWGKYYEKHPDKSKGKFKCYMPEDWILKIITQEEYDELKNVSGIEWLPLRWQDVKEILEGKAVVGEDEI